MVSGYPEIFFYFFLAFFSVNDTIVKDVLQS